MRSKIATGGCLLLALLAVSGCHHRLNGPNVPEVLKQNGAAAYGISQFNTDLAGYKKAVAENRLTDARLQRDAMINRIETDIESNYRDFEGSLTSTRAGIETGADVVELGLSAAIGVVGGSDVKDLLAASLSGFKGTHLSFDKNVFREKTTEVLISQMQAYRDLIRNRITTKVSTLDVGSYSFEEAWRDLVEFFYAGTLPAALQQLANQTGKAAADEKDKATAIDVKRANTAEEAQAAIRIRQKYAALAALARDTDAAKQDSARKQLQEILVLLGDTPEAQTADLDALLKSLREQIRLALTNPAQIPVLDKVLTPAPQP